MFQANQTFAQVQNVTGGEDGFFGSAGSALIFGIVLAVLVAAVILGGIKSIGSTTSKLVPAMGFIYVASCLLVIFVNIGQVPAAFGAIIQGAFAPAGIAGGVVGVMIVGFQRAAFSNEAGLGSAAIAHSAVKTRRPVSEGFVALFEPLVDTVLICTMTALAIIIAGAPSLQDGIDQVQAGEGPPDGVTLTSDAFATVLPVVPDRAGRRRGTLRLLDAHHLVLLRAEGLGVPLRPREDLGGPLQGHLPVLHRRRLRADLQPGHQLRRRRPVRLRLREPARRVPAAAVIKREMKEYLADRKSGKLAELGIEPEDSRPRSL
jgi:AGCS family alanine or glycine:cation symporter